jgi:hypothetical protein
MEQVRDWLKGQFPYLGEGFVVTSPPTNDYNCIAWAAGDDEAWWWPAEDRYWPPEVPRVQTVAAFFAAFALLGYEVCSDTTLEPDFEKVILYCKNGEPKHMSRQLSSGHWTSKLGRSFDISHALPEAVFGPDYGDEMWILRRPARR